MGLGLGLAIVRHMVEPHGGSVSVERAGAGKGGDLRDPRAGACGPGRPGRWGLRPRLPDAGARAEENAGSDGIGPTAIHKPLAGRDVIIVEDDLSAAEMLAHAFDDEGAAVRVVHSAGAALALIAG
ncbi:MAG: hypothetical protein ACRYGL_15165 [Janthinobacterium lividum]